MERSTARERRSGKRIFFFEEEVICWETLRLISTIYAVEQPCRLSCVLNFYLGHLRWIRWLRHHSPIARWICCSRATSHPRMQRSTPREVERIHAQQRSDGATECMQMTGGMQREGQEKSCRRKCNVLRLTSRGRRLGVCVVGNISTIWTGNGAERTKHKMQNEHPWSINVNVVQLRDSKSDNRGRILQGKRNWHHGNCDDNLSSLLIMWARRINRRGTVQVTNLSMWSRALKLILHPPSGRHFTCDVLASAKGGEKCSEKND